MNQLEINTSTLFSLVFANNTILSCSFFFFLIINLQFLIAAVTTQIFILTTEIALPTGIPTKEVKAGMKSYHIKLKWKLK